MADPSGGTADAAPSSPPVRPGPVYLTVLVIATCGLVYELVAGTVASYLLGDSVTQFSLVIGVYLTALGAGAWLSKLVERGLARRFVDVEISVALLGGLSSPLLFLAFSSGRFFRPIFFAVVFGIGVLVGLEIPLMLRLLRGAVAFKELVAQVLAFDYLGALLASVAFPLIFLPGLGLVRTSLAFGLLNAAVAFASIRIFRERIGPPAVLLIRAGAVTAILLGAFAFADRLTSLAEEAQYTDPVLVAKTSPYQRIVVTRNSAGFQLFLNGHLQFSSVDEYRYHEALVHPAFALVPGARRVAVLGGGDGLAVREVLRHPSVERVFLVDLDPAVTGLAKTNPLLVELNARSLLSPKVTILNRDAMGWLEEVTETFDLLIADFPDPSTFSVGKLYTSRFYALARARLAEGGALVVQATSPLFARKSFWIVERTIAAAGFFTRAYHATVPSFGEWGFVLAAARPFAAPATAMPGLRYLTGEVLASLFMFPADMAAVDAPVNRLNNQVLVHTYESEWRRYE